MKKNMFRLFLGLCLLVMCTLCPGGKTKVLAATKAAVKKEYVEFMKTQPSYVKYRMIDITKDGVPELITKTAREKAGNLKSHRFVIYTYSNGEVKYYSGFYEKYKSLHYYPKTNVLVLGSFGKKGKRVFEYFKCTNNNKGKLIAYSYYLKGKRHYVYKDKYCLKADFNKHMKKLIGSRKMKTIKF